MAIYPKAIYRRVAWAERAVQGRQGVKPNVYIMHVAVSEASSLFEYFNYQPNESCSHFYIRRDGTVEQYIDTAYRSVADRAAGLRAISVETQGGFNAATVETEKWTEKQLQALAELGAWVNRTHGIPVQPTANSVKTTAGFSYHRRGIKGNWTGAHAGTGWVAGEEWSGFGKSCPGLAKINQIPEIIRRTKLILNPPAPPAPPKPVVSWTAVTGGARKIKTSAKVEIIDLLTGQLKGTVNANTFVDIADEATVSGKRYLRSLYSKNQGFPWGMLATAFIENPAPPKPPEPVVPVPPKPVEPVITWKSLTGGARKLTTKTKVNIVDLVSGANKGNVDVGVQVEIADETVVNGQRYFRSVYSKSKNFSWGMLATAFIENPEPVIPPKPVEPEPEKPIVPVVSVEVETIIYDTINKEDNTQIKGYKYLESEGVDGLKVIVNSDNKKVAEEIKPPVSRVVVYGTK